MFVSKAVKINEKNHLEIGGCDCLELADKYGTPLYVMDENLLRENCRKYKDAIDKYYDGNGLALYASKALCTTAICKIVHQEGLGLDVVSGGELYTAITAGFPMDKAYFHGNNKTYEELLMAIENDIGRIVIDNKEELMNVNQIAKKLNKIVNVSFRIKPGIDAHTHDFIRTGQIDSKFGVALENGEAFEIIKKAVEFSNINVMALHCHIGSQIFDLEPFKLAAKVMLEFAASLKEKLDIEIKELNLGGGFGIKYTQEDQPIEYDHYIKSVSEVVKSVCSEKEIKLPQIVMEPGRSIAAPAGITLYKVGSVKEIKNIRKYVAVDGGMTDNPRFAMYQAKYEAAIVDKPDAPKTEKVTIAGKCCESGDLLAKDVMLPEVNVGDILATFATGGYTYSMSSNYNRIPRPPIVLVKDGKARTIVKREDYKDIIRNDIIPEDL
ncbi:diaminopimelate decarboxylase [Herbivorax sp. ANBcel31]|uniref:diaminopimelate decarboxylase n=1 Tax=Herbivorax sp. ANBcel31 TaxID=3069754 RepID=UPI0027B68310|nr:diaminopimelate decarboxylase [Herbivorax sp. ANBcel31]MDQ2086208.1 diaminopimelate decarboxylase [Herbivorax sp. ANBcel31]